MTKVAVCANVHAPPIKVSHASLRPASGESLYRKRCPVCETGVLLVYRDPVSFMLRSVDRCIHCGQQVIYTDRYIAGEPVVNVLDPS
jgi:hypothetical protein